MTDAQNERTKSQGRRRRRRPQRREAESVERTQEIAAEQRTAEPIAQEPAEAITSADVRPPNIEAPTDRYDVYCVHHMASQVEAEPIHVRTNMTTLRHLAVDHFGAATLYCDCLHNGPHEWPPSLHPLETAVELDQFLAASTNEA